MEIGHVTPTRLSVPQTVDREFVGDNRPPAAATNETITAVQPVPAKPAASAAEERRDPDSTGLRVSVDPDARQIVYQTVDSFTGEVVVQTPDKAMLRQRAYAIQLQDARIAAELDTTDRSGAVQRSV